MAREAKTFKVEDAEILFRNFAGEVGPFNAAGDRTFAVILDEEAALLMLEDGWNVKYLKSREEGDEPRPYIQVKVGYKAKPPHVVMITDNGPRSTRVNLTEDMISILDYADISHVDLIARAFDWDINGKTGTSAYLQTMFVTVEQDELQQKYAEDPDEN